MPISNWLFVIVLLGVVPAIFLYMLLAPMRALRNDRRDILANGQAAIGTIVAIDENPALKSIRTYGVTVEFTPTDYRDPVRFTMTLTRSSDINKLGVYQQVPIHYRVQTPLEAVIDEFVK
jgi:hypothetical protein